MLQEPRWVRYFLQPKPEGGTAKIPLGSHSDPGTWRSFDECVKAIENDQQGLGYNFLGGDIHGLDVDHCRNPKTGQLCNEAMLLLSRLGSWSEFSVSGAGIHVLFKGNVRGKQLTETCLQYWNPKNAPRFFAITCDMVGEAFTGLKDIGDDFNYIFATARHISAKIREELKGIDEEQWKHLPAEREHIEPAAREKSKTKTRKVHKDFDLKDFLAFYNIGIDNETENELGHCIRVTSCPIKGEPHVGQNSTTTNFIFPTKDAGFAFHCQSTGCVEYGIGDVVKKLAEEREVYPRPIWEKKERAAPEEQSLIYTFDSLDDITEEALQWLWPGYLPDNKLVHFVGASSEGKSPVTRDLIPRVTRGLKWPCGAENILGPRSVLLLAGEDDLADTVKPALRVGGADMKKVRLMRVTAKKGDKENDLAVALNRDTQGMMESLQQIPDLSLIVIDPITNYLGGIGMNKEDELRQHISMPLRELAGHFKVCVITVGHLNKRDKDTPVLQRAMGAAAFTGVPRKVFVFGPDPTLVEKYAHVMKEVRDNQVAIQYKTVGMPDPAEIQKSAIIQVEWGKPVEVDAEDLIGGPTNSEKTAAKEAGAFVRGFVSDGAKSSKAIEDALNEQGIKCTSWQRAAKKVGCDKRKMKGSKTSGWEWFLVSAQTQEMFDGDK